VFGVDQNLTKTCTIPADVASMLDNTTANGGGGDDGEAVQDEDQD
jgi:hypothetical protein